MKKIPKLITGFLILFCLASNANAVQTGLTGNNQEEFLAYTRHIDIIAGAAGVGVTAPVTTTIGTSRTLCFNRNTELAFIQWEMGEDWNEASDYELQVIWSPEVGDPLANGETAIFDIDYYSIATGEALDNGTIENATVTHTQSGAGIEIEMYEHDIAIPYNSGNQQLSEGDTVYARFFRDFDTDTYAGEACVHRWEVKFTANKLPYH